MPENLSNREQSMLDFIRSFQIEHGYSPSLREIGHHVGIDSTSLISYYLDRLVNAGCIKRDAKISRSIVVLGRVQ